MKTRRLGRSDVTVSEIGFGAWAIGGGLWGAARDDDARAALERAFALGCTFVDTALTYGDGHSERLVGQALARHPEVTVATKVPPRDQHWPARPGARLSDAFPARWITECAERSLKNLRRERIDLLQLHVWADAWTDEDAWWHALDQLRQAGKVRLLGVSINSHDPRSALRLVRSGRVDALQVLYNVFDQSPEDELFPACREQGVGVLARVPFDEGSLTGKLRLDTVFPPGDFRAGYFRGPLLAETVGRVERLRPILEGAGQAGAGAGGGMARGALRFCLSHPAVSTVIPGIRSPAQAAENCAASDDGPLPADVLERLRLHRWVRAPY
jgi:aryl-alcohol dehydrogenase-like predicted oxidoreductase